MTSTPDNNSLLSDQDTNRFLVYARIKSQISFLYTLIHCVRFNYKDDFLIKKDYIKRSWLYIYILNSIRTWCKTHILSLKSQHTTSSYHIFKNKHNHTQSILIPIYKSNQIGNLLRCYKVW